MNLSWFSSIRKEAYLSFLVVATARPGSLYCPNKMMLGRAKKAKSRRMRVEKVTSTMRIFFGGAVAVGIGGGVVGIKEGSSGDAVASKLCEASAESTALGTATERELKGVASDVGERGAEGG